MQLVATNKSDMGADYLLWHFMSGLVGCKTSTGKRRECCGGLPGWEASYVVEAGTE